MDLRDARTPFDRPPVTTHPSEASAVIDVPDSADAVWRLIGGFGSLPDWLPYIVTSELGEGGRTRHLANNEGDDIVERLVAFDDAARSYSYAFIQAPFPVTDYLSTLQVLPLPTQSASRVRWSGRFTPAGIGSAEATEIFQRMYTDGLAALAGRYAETER